MNNKVEILRSLCFTKEDMEDITNLGDAFSEIDIDFMVEFKKIYELGLPQLYKFIDKLDSDGSELDEYSIMYYTSILRNGPLGVYVSEYSKDKKYFSSYPDILGNNGNLNISISNTSMYMEKPVSLGCSVDTFNKLPSFMQKTLAFVNTSEEMFKSSLISGIVHDNTLPLADKKPQLRYDKESSWDIYSHGSYMTKDLRFIDIIQKISGDLYDKIKETIGSENFRIFEQNKTYSPFNVEKNQSVSTNTKIKKKLKSGDISQDVELDILGDVLDTPEKRGNLLKISNDEKSTDYERNTPTGEV